MGFLFVTDRAGNDRDVAFSFSGISSVGSRERRKKNRDGQPGRNVLSLSLSATCQSAHVLPIIENSKRIGSSAAIARLYASKFTNGPFDEDRRRLKC